MYLNGLTTASQIVSAASIEWGIPSIKFLLSSVLRVASGVLIDITTSLEALSVPRDLRFHIPSRAFMPTRTCVRSLHDTPGRSGVRNPTENPTLRSSIIVFP